MVAKGKGVDSRSISQTVANICNKFITDECCFVGGKFCYVESKLAMEEKFVKLCNWRSDLNMNDSKLLDIFE